MAYIDTKHLGKCETCRHHRSGECNTFCDCGEEYSPDMLKIPTADVVEVVRCKDCKHCQQYQKWNFDKYLGCNFNEEIYEVEPNHFAVTEKGKKTMTDNEIIKALEEMADYPHYYEEGQMLKNVLDLINRQKAEIRKYKNAYEQVKWERDLFEEQCKTAKAEAIKEFAERLKGLLALNIRVSNEEYLDITTDINNLVKEMEGDKR